MATTRTAATTAAASQAEDTAEAGGGTKIQLAEVRRPLFASVGAADFAVEKLRELPASYADEIKKLSSRVNGLQGQVKDLPVAVSGTLKALPTQVQSGLSDLQGRATRLYGDLATRGEKRVSAIRRSPATQEAVARTRTAVVQTRAARTSTRRAAGAAGKAVQDAVSKD